MENGLSKLRSPRRWLAEVLASGLPPLPTSAGLITATRAAGLMLLLGAGLIAVTVALPPAANGSDLLILGYGAVAALAGAVLISRRRVSARWLGVMAAVGTAVITLSTLEAGTGVGADDNQVLYLWVCVYSFWFFSTRHALLQVALIGVADAALLLDEGPSLAAAVTRWLVVITTFLTIGLLIVWLRRTLDRQREETARLAVVAERMRIARELHDAAGQGIGAISIQAEAGLIALDRDPEAARAAIEEIKRTSQIALADMRRLLGVLRPDDPSVDLRERVSVGHMEELVRDSSRAGVKTRLEISGATEPLPVPVDQAAYRIVQEALANVREHAGAGVSCTVRLGYLPGALEVEVRDNGSGAVEPEGSGGSGLAGMRERAELFGGDFEAGPAASGGFRVFARLPTGSRVTNG